MSLLTKNELQKRINSGETNQIYVDPILSEQQIGAVTLDLRLGCDFLVSVLNQNASVALHPPDNKSGPESFFQSTRRDVGDTFLLHPSQTVLAATLEYVGLPDDVYADVMTRSSYHRMGVVVSSMFQPGFRGCLSIELSNHSNVPVELIVGGRLIQVRFFANNEEETYFQDGTRRKYIANVRPSASKASYDNDLLTLREIAKRT